MSFFHQADTTRRDIWPHAPAVVHPRHAGRDDGPTHELCPHSLSEDHGGASCPHNPNPPILGWLQSPMPVQWVQPSQFQPSSAAAQRPAPAREVCRNYNMNRCRFSRCRYAHVHSDCGGAHMAPSCPSPRQFPDRGPAPRGRPSPRVIQNQKHYLPREAAHPNSRSRTC